MINRVSSGTLVLDYKKFILSNVIAIMEHCKVLGTKFLL